MHSNIQLLFIYRRIPHTEEKRRELKAKEIKVKYMNKKYFFGPNSPAGRQGQEKVGDKRKIEK